MSNIAYIRVSTIEQNTDRQEIAMSDKGIDRYFIEKVSGKSANRPEYKKMLEYVREGDVLYIESISRLARSTKDLLATVEILKNKGVELISLKESIDTNTPQGKFMLTVFGALAELERENTLQRQREGIEAAKSKGTLFGRPTLNMPKDFERIYAEWKAGKIKAVTAMDMLGIKKTSFYKMVKVFEQRRGQFKG